MAIMLDHTSAAQYALRLPSRQWNAQSSYCKSAGTMAECATRIHRLKMPEVDDVEQHQHGEHPQHSRWQLGYVAALPHA
jgi:hypothetical protein